MNRKIVSSLIALCIVGVASSAFAQEAPLVVPAPEPVVPTVPVAPEPVQPNYRTEYHPDISSSNPYKFHAGISASIGFPTGGSVGVLVSPWLPWLKLGADANWNYVGAGLGGHATIDPFNSSVGLTLTGEAGGFFPSTIPSIHNSPTVSYTYESALLGVEFGSRRHVRFFLRGGITHVDANVSNFGNAFTLPAGVSIGSPNVNLIAPSGQIGFDWLF
jgi:hypothetical protein